MAKKKAKRKPTDGKEHLPPWVAWITDHPLLMMSEVELEGEDIPARKRNTLKREAVAYEKEHQCPSRYARSMLAHYRGQSAKLDKLAHDVNRHYADFNRKKIKKVEQEEDEAIADLKKVFTAALGSGI